jgi:hypothetical protein
MFLKGFLWQILGGLVNSKAMTPEQPSTLLASLIALRQDQVRVHHLIVLVLQIMAVPDIFSQDEVKGEEVNSGLEASRPE